MPILDQAIKAYKNRTVRVCNAQSFWPGIQVRIYGECGGLVRQTCVVQSRNVKRGIIRLDEKIQTHDFIIIGAKHA